MEDSSVKFYNASGQAMDGLALLQSLGMNSIRLAPWVNPSGGFCNTADVVAKAVRAHKLGMRILIDFHYSDTWADPRPPNPTRRLDELRSAYTHQRDHNLYDGRS